jgi:hypothetical protein
MMSDNLVIYGQKLFLCSFVTMAKGCVYLRFVIGSTIGM